MDALDYLYVLILVVMFPLGIAFNIAIRQSFRGWKVLAKHYQTTDTPSGRKSLFQTMRINGKLYEHVTITTTGDGLLMELPPILRWGRPRLFIPWTDFYQASLKDYILEQRLVVEVGNPSIATIRLSPDIFEGSRAGRARLAEISKGTNVPSL